MTPPSPMQAFDGLRVNPPVQEAKEALRRFVQMLAAITDPLDRQAYRSEAVQHCKALRVPDVEEMMAAAESVGVGGHTGPRAAVLNLPDHPSAQAVRNALLTIKQQYIGITLSRLDARTEKHELVQALKAKHVTGAKEFVDDALTDLMPKDGDDVGGEAIDFSTPEPWEQPVDGVALLDELTTLVTRYLVLFPHVAEATAAWTILTYLTGVESVDTLPILGIVSPTKRCGKTRFVQYLSYLVNRPLPASNITPAAVYRTVSAHAPTLMVDEADTFLVGNDELRGVFNSGHKRDTASIIRTVGDDHEPRRFSTWCCRALAMIGRLPDTLEDRAILVKLRRKTKAEKVERKLRRTPQFKTLARKIVRWVADNKARLVADPTIPEALDDRAADNWEPLLMIAETVGGTWPEKMRQAALVLCGEREEDAANVLLIQDLRKRFDRDVPLVDFLSTDHLLNYLTENSETAARPWKTWRKGKPMDAAGLARALRPFGVTPGQKKTAPDAVTRGYWREAFEDAWRRYPPKNEAPTPPDDGPGSGVAPLPGPCFSSEPLPPLPHSQVMDSIGQKEVAARNGKMGSECAVSIDEIRPVAAVAGRFSKEPLPAIGDNAPSAQEWPAEWRDLPVDEEEVMSILRETRE